MQCHPYNLAVICDVTVHQLGKVEEEGPAVFQTHISEAANK